MKFWQIKAQAGAGKNPQLMVYGDIGEWMDVDSRRFNAELAAIDAPEIDVMINSDGGSVFTASAIYSALKRHPASINVYVDGIAASAASLIAMAGDRVIMPLNAMMMIHNPLTVVIGNAEEMRQYADLLDKVASSMHTAYLEKTGMEEAKLKELLADETYMTALEALDYGFADEIEETRKVAASVSHAKMVVNGQTMRPERLKNMPDSVMQALNHNPEPPVDPPAPEPQPTAKTPAGSAGKSKPEEEPMDLEKLKAEHPDLYKKVREEGVTAGQDAERTRIQAIEDMAMKGHEELIAKAKFETGMSAEALAVELIKAEKAKGQTFLANRGKDAEELEDVDPGATDDTDPQAVQNAAEEEKRNKLVAAAAKGYNARAGHKSQ